MIEPSFLPGIAVGFAIGIVLRFLYEWLPDHLPVWRLRFRVRCPDCEGTGICHQKSPLRPHSCCGDCERIEVPRENVPKDFNNGYRCGDGTVTIGSGVLCVGLIDYVRAIWRHGRRAFPLKKIANPHLDPSRTKQSAAMRTH